MNRPLVSKSVAALFSSKYSAEPPWLQVEFYFVARRIAILITIYVKVLILDELTTVARAGIAGWKRKSGRIQSGGHS